MEGPGSTGAESRDCWFVGMVELERYAFPPEVCLVTARVRSPTGGYIFSLFVSARGGGGEGYHGQDQDKVALPTPNP